MLSASMGEAAAGNVHFGYEPVIIATKMDKIKRSQLQKHLKMIRTTLGMSKEGIILPFSALSKQGREEIVDLLDGVLEDLSEVSADGNE